MTEAQNDQHTLNFKHVVDTTTQMWEYDEMSIA